MGFVQRRAYSGFGIRVGSLSGIGEEPQKEIGGFVVALALPKPALWPWASYLTSLGLFPYRSNE